MNSQTFVNQKALLYSFQENDCYSSKYSLTSNVNVSIKNVGILGMIASQLLL